jgi:hypothetical protein
MDQDTFDQHRSDIMRTVDLLLQRLESRRRFRLFAIYEQGTGQLLAEVIRTTHGPVVVSRALDGGRDIQPLSADLELEFVTRRGRYRLLAGDVLESINEGTRKATVRPGLSVMRRPQVGGTPVPEKAPAAYRQRK